MKFLKNTAVYTVLGFLPLISSFLLLPINIRYLTPADYATANLAAITESYIGLMLGLAINMAMVRFYRDSYKDREEVNKLLSTTLCFYILSSVIGAAILYFKGEDIFKLVWEDSLPFYPFGWFILIGALFQMLSIVLYEFYRAAEQVKKVFYITVISFSCSVAGGIIGVVVLDLGALGNVAGKALGLVIPVSVFVILVLNTTKIRFSYSLLREMVKYSVPIALFSLLNIVNNSLDKYFLNQYITLDDLGIYTLAFTLTTPVGILITSYGSAVLPTMYKEMTDDGSLSHLQKFIDGLFALTFLCIWGLIILSKPLISFMVVDAKFISATYFVPVLVLVAVGQAFWFTVTYNITYHKKTKYLPYITSITLVLSVLLMYFLTQKFGVWGAAIALVLVKTIQVLIGLTLNRSMFKANFNMLYYLIPTAVTVFFVLINYLFLYDYFESIFLIHMLEGLIVLTTFAGKFSELKDMALSRN